MGGAPPHRHGKRTAFDGWRYFDDEFESQEKEAALTVGSGRHSPHHQILVK
jgi:hypothetical protein